MLAEVLYNGQAGLIDINLNQKQEVLSAYAYSSTMNDYGMFVLYGEPREHQPLELVQELLLQQLENVKNGNWDEGLLEAIVNRMKLNRIRMSESNRIAHTFVSYFTSDLPWSDYLEHIDKVARITKQDLSQFAMDNFGYNHVRYSKESAKTKT